MSKVINAIRRQDTTPARYPNGYDELRTACQTDTLAALEAATQVIGKGGIILFCACRGDTLEQVAEQLRLTPNAVNHVAGWMVAQAEQRTPRVAS